MLCPYPLSGTSLQSARSASAYASTIGRPPPWCCPVWLLTRWRSVGHSIIWHPGHHLGCVHTHTASRVRVSEAWHIAVLTDGALQGTVSFDTHIIILDGYIGTTQPAWLGWMRHDTAVLSDDTAGNNVIWYPGRHLRHVMCFANSKVQGPYILIFVRGVRGQGDHATGWLGVGGCMEGGGSWEVLRKV